MNQSLDFDDNTWHNFSQETKTEISKIRRMKNQQRNLNSVLSDGYDRNIHDVNIQGNSLPPAPSGTPPSRPGGGNGTNQVTTDNAGAAFGRSSGRGQG